MYKTTEEDLEQSLRYRRHPKTTLVAKVVNQVLDEYLVEEIKTENEFFVKIAVPESEITVLGKHVMHVTQEELEAIEGYTGKLIDLVDPLFSDYLKYASVAPSKHYATFAFTIRK